MNVRRDSSMPLCFSIQSDSEDDTFNLGSQMAPFAYEGLCIILSGELGSGKTVFAKGFASFYSSTPARSPSFTLVNEYPGHIPVVHVDLYRLPETDGYDIGLFDYQKDGCIILVEWGERWSLPPEENLWHISFRRAFRKKERALQDGGNTRLLLSVRCKGEKACHRLAECMEKLQKYWRVSDESDSFS